VPLGKFNKEDFMAITSNRRTHQVAYETNTALNHPLLSWRSVVAGLLVAFLAHTAIMGLGLGLGGVTLQNTTDASAQTAGIIGGAWFLIACVLSIALGSFFAARAAKLHTGQVAGAQGLVITALFFGVMFWQLSNMVAFVGGTAGSAATTAAQTAATASNNPALQDNVNNIANSVNSNQIGEQVNDIKAQVTGNAEEVKDSTAAAMQAVGWSLFVSIVLSVIAAYAGGALGAAANVRKPLIVDDMVTDRMTGATL
jgi:hypothetical protein